MYYTRSPNAAAAPRSLNADQAASQGTIDAAKARTNRVTNQALAEVRQAASQGTLDAATALGSLNAGQVSDQGARVFFYS